jgi:hypothetical protein
MMLAMGADEVEGMRAVVAAGRAPNRVIRMADRATHLVFAVIAGALGVEGPRLSSAREDITAQNSGGWQQLLPTLKSGGTVTFDVIYEAAAHVDLLEASLQQSVELFQWSVGGSTLQFSALVEMGFVAQVFNEPRAAVKLTVTGVVARV